MYSMSSVVERLVRAPMKVAGAKAVLRALREGRLASAFIARDADPFVTRPVADACDKARVAIIEVDNMSELGRACALSVNTAVAGILKGS